MEIRFIPPEKVADFPRRRLYARLSRIDYLSSSPYKRASFEFDGIDADATDAAGEKVFKYFAAEETEPFALLRIVTTRRRFVGILGDDPIVGDWYALEIEPAGSKGGLMTWHAQLAASGYSTHSRGLTVDGERLAIPGESPRGTPPRSLGAAASAKRSLPSHINDLSQIATVSANQKMLAQLVVGIPAPATIVVHDVGQASFNSFLDKNGDAYLHFDTGLPISFNNHTRPKKLTVHPTSDPLVVLSHWDWDHLHGAFSLQYPLKSKWIVPSQRLGPGAARLAKIVADKGNLFVWPAGTRISSSAVTLMDCSGPSGVLNDTGLVLHTKLTSGNCALLTGDVDYQYLPNGAAALAPINHLVVTHHGASLKSASLGIPSPAGFVGKVVVSYGNKNVYRHPNDVSRTLHLAAGWGNWVPTAGVKGGPRRASRILR